MDSDTDGPPSAAAPRAVSIVMVEPTAPRQQRRQEEEILEGTAQEADQEDDNHNTNTQGEVLLLPLLHDDHNHNNKQQRWLVLALTCIVMTCIYYSLDIPAALHQQLHDCCTDNNSDNTMFEWHFNLLYTVYSTPNVILPFVGGTIVDRLGASQCLVLFAALCCAGQVVFTLGVAVAAAATSANNNSSSNNGWMYMIMGRALYGLGGESICVAYSTLLAEWFTTTTSAAAAASTTDDDSDNHNNNNENSSSNNNNRGELALAFGIALAVSRLGSVLNDIISPMLANNNNNTHTSISSTAIAVGFGAGLNGLAVTLALAIWYLDRKYHHDRTTQQRLGADNYSSTSITNGDLTEPLLPPQPLIIAAEDQEITPLDDEHVNGDDDDNETNNTSNLHNHAPSSGGGGGGQEEVASSSTTEQQQQHQPPQFRGTPLFWLLALSCLVVYACILPWNNVASGILLERDLFRQLPADCQLQFPDECSVGRLQNRSNPTIRIIHTTTNHSNTTATDAIKTECPSVHYAPRLPDSLNVTGTDGVRRVFANMTANNVDCKDSFWSVDCTHDYCRQLDKATEQAGRLMAIPYTISAMLSPVLGRIVDGIGQRALLSSVAALLLTAVHMSLATSSVSPILPLFGQGIAYALYASVLWPSVTLTTPAEYTGRAFGVITSIQNIGLAGFPMVVAGIYQLSGMRYIPYAELFFAVCASMGILVGIALHVVDGRTGGKLNRPQSSG